MKTPEIDPQIRAQEMRDRGIDPSVEYPGANNPWPSVCMKCNTKVSPRYSTVVGAGKGGCNSCAQKESAKTRSEIAGRKAQIKASELGLNPLEEYPGAHQRWRLVCNSCGTEMSPRAASVLQGRGCRVCGNRRSAEKLRSASEPKALEAFVNAGLLPISKYQGMNVPWPSKCLTCGQFVSPRPSGIKSGQGGCLDCGRRRSAKTRSISVEVAYDEMLAAAVMPNNLDTYQGAGKPWPGICLVCGLPVSPTLNNLRAGHGGCKRCSAVAADSSFDFFGPAIFYLIFNDDLKASKVGIAGKLTNRLKDHARNNWQIFNLIEVEKGYDAWYLEGAVLAWLRGDLQLAASVRESQMPQGGFTETYSTLHLDLENAWIGIQSIWASKSWSVPLSASLQEGKSKSRRKCHVEEDGIQCSGIHYSLGYCKQHYRAFKLYGDPLHKLRTTSQNEFCDVEIDGNSCGKEVSRKGMCSVHYYRNYIHGDPKVKLKPWENTPKSAV